MIVKLYSWRIRKGLSPGPRIGSEGSVCDDNVTIVQSNLDYFQAPFDACPCCYGSIRSFPLAYPRSVAFRASGLTYETYLSLAHAADQTHDGDNSKTLQGYRCMGIVDNDRAAYGREMGYDVRLRKL